MYKPYDNTTNFGGWKKVTGKKVFLTGIKTNQELSAWQKQNTMIPRQASDTNTHRHLKPDLNLSMNPSST